MTTTNPLAATETPPGVAPPATAPASPPAVVYPTPEQVQQVCPQADAENIRKNLPYVLKAMCTAGLTTPNQIIAIIATIYTEVRSFAPIREGGGASASYAPAFGRGYIQLTWSDNYTKAAADLNIPGMESPSGYDLALDPGNAARITVWYWKGGSGNQSIVPFAEQQDWRNCRSIVNAGSPGRWNVCHGKDVYLETIERGKTVFTQPLDPAAIGVMPVDGAYGLNCADGGYGGNHTYNQSNPQSQGSALAQALGITARAMTRGVKFQGRLNPAVKPEILNLDAQTTFDLDGVNEDLNGTYTVEEVVFEFPDGESLEADVLAYQPDPNAPSPQIFLHDTTQGVGPGQPALPPGGAPVAAGEIPTKIYQAAVAAKGRSSSRGPSGGKLACAWTTNLFCILPAGLQNIGNIKGQDGVTVAVREMTKALEGGRGQKVSRAEAVPGDIWISPGERHVGVVMTAGKIEVLSNSSSNATFSWQDDIDAVNGSYGGGPEHGLYRVTN